jgi:hypothetical protein
MAGVLSLHAACAVPGELTTRQAAVVAVMESQGFSPPLSRFQVRA